MAHFAAQAVAVSLLAFSGQADPPPQGGLFEEFELPPVTREQLESAFKDRFPKPAVPPWARWLGGAGGTPGAGGLSPAALAAMAQVRILCGHRRGRFGVSHWNGLAEEWLFGAAGAIEAFITKRWSRGRAGDQAIEAAGEGTADRIDAFAATTNDENFDLCHSLFVMEERILHNWLLTVVQPIRFRRRQLRRGGIMAERYGKRRRNHIGILRVPECRPLLVLFLFLVLRLFVRRLFDKRIGGVAGIAFTRWIGVARHGHHGASRLHAVFAKLTRQIHYCCHAFSHNLCSCNLEHIPLPLD